MTPNLTEDEWTALLKKRGVHTKSPRKVKRKAVQVVKCDRCPAQSTRKDAKILWWQDGKAYRVCAGCNRAFWNHLAAWRIETLAAAKEQT